MEGILRRIRPCDMDAPFLFVSYSARDRETVYPDVLELQRRGYNLWLDERNLDKTKPSWKQDALAAVEDMYCSQVLLYAGGYRSGLAAANGIPGGGV